MNPQSRSLIPFGLPIDVGRSRKMIKQSFIVFVEALLMSLVVLYLAEFFGLAFVREAGGHFV